MQVKFDPIYNNLAAVQMYFELFYNMRFLRTNANYRRFHPRILNTIRAIFGIDRRKNR